MRMFSHHKKGSGAHGFDIVANFSAHKHVRSEKDIYSVEALLRNNVISAKLLLDLLEQYLDTLMNLDVADEAMKRQLATLRFEMARAWEEHI